MELMTSGPLVINAAAPVRKLAEHIRSNASMFKQRLGQFEADVEALNLILLASGHALATAETAATSTSLLLSACVLARACMDSGALALWLLRPDDPFEREARWLTQLRTDASARRRLAGYCIGTETEEWLKTTADAVANFASEVERMLPEGYTPPARVPKMDKLLKEIGSPEKYALYIRFSQATHGTHFGTGAHRRHLGMYKEQGEFVSEAEWALPLSTCWWFMAVPVITLAERYSVPREAVLPVELEHSFDKAQKSLVKMEA